MNAVVEAILSVLAIDSSRLRYSISRRTVQPPIIISMLILGALKVLGMRERTSVVMASMFIWFAPSTSWPLIADCLFALVRAALLGSRTLSARRFSIGLTCCGTLSIDFRSRERCWNQDSGLDLHWRQW